MGRVLTGPARGRSSPGRLEGLAGWGSFHRVPGRVIPEIVTNFSAVYSLTSS